MNNFSLDLIFAIPGQDAEAALEDIERAVALGPKHVSFYNLTLKPGHPLYRALPTEDDAATLYERGIAKLAALGYEQYEISNFAQAGFASRHNQLYWDGGDFLGVGPSAASRFFWDGTFHHRKQVADYSRYLQQDTFTSLPFEATTWSQTVLEAAFLELRKNRGVSLADFEMRYGYSFRRARRFSLFSDEGLIVVEGDRLTLTARGRMLADSVTGELVDDFADDPDAAFIPRAVLPFQASRV